MALAPWQIKQPYVELDRWLLPRLAELGALAAYVFSEDAGVQRAGGQRALSSAEVSAWLRSAARRGLIEAQTVDLDGTPLRPPRWYLTDVGRERLKQARPFSASLRLAPLRHLWAKLFERGRPNWATVVEAINQQDPHWEDQEVSPDPHKIRLSPEASSEAEALENLCKIDHIVVLMLENRSFDHMLGYLTLRGQAEVRGLTGGPEQANQYQGTSYKPRRLGVTRIPKSQDPCHSIKCVQDQLENENGGFVQNFATHVDPENPGLVMGYHTGDQLPVYDYLAHTFTICDRWHSSIPGSTWPNRLYSLAARADPTREGVFDGPLWDFKSFPQHLDAVGVKWRWYSHDPATLRVVDSEYRKVDGFFRRENFRYFDRKTVGDATRVTEELIVSERDSFLDDVRQGQLGKNGAGGLPSVSWIDPNFIDLSLFERNSNDDHPPSDIHAGQALVLDTFRALVESEKLPFEKTLLIVTYDEHGGFYDHVPPPEAPDDDSRFRRYGVRVPAFVISPWVEPGRVSHTLFDHTSIIKTILCRFAPEAADEMGLRVAKAHHLGRLLTRSEPAPVPDYHNAVQAVANWQANQAGRGVVATPVPTGDPPPLTGFQAEMMQASRQLRKDGLPAGQP